MNWENNYNNFDNNINTNTNMLKPMKTRYVMGKNNNNNGMAYNPPATEYSFYQVCSYPEDGFFYVRKLIYNEAFHPVDVYEKPYPKKKIDKFIEKTPKHKFQMYPVSNLKLLAYPNPNQVISANSTLLN
jgi:hypothetical protein